MTINRKYLKISEAASFCSVKEYILRYWEKQFEELNPTKRNKHRYYQQKDINLILEIKDLLMKKKYTLSGAKKIITTEFGSSKNKIHSLLVDAKTSLSANQLKSKKQTKRINSLKLVSSKNSRNLGNKPHYILSSENRLFEVSESDINHKKNNNLKKENKTQKNKKNTEQAFKQQKIKILEELKIILADLKN